MAQTERTGVPDGYHSLTPSLTVKDIAQSIDFYRRAFGAEERMRLMTPDGHR
jgi:PhnB protein